MTLRSSTLDPLLSKLLTRQPLSDADQQAVTPLPHTVRRLSKAEYLVREGDRSPSVGVLLSGFAFRQKILSDGSRQIPLLPRFKERGGRCHIVNTASMAGIVPMITVGAYSSAKFASVGLSMVLRDELRGSDIGVSVLCPGRSHRGSPKPLDEEKLPSPGRRPTTPPLSETPS